MGIRSIPLRRRMTTVSQNAAMVSRQLTARADQNPQPWRHIQGRIRNIGKVGSTNQNVLSAWFASRWEDWPAWCIQAMATSEVSGRAISKADSRR